MRSCERMPVCAQCADVHVVMRGSAHLCQEMYCAGNRFACARFRAYECLCDREVPADLKPHEHWRLKELLAV